MNRRAILAAAPALAVAACAGQTSTQVATDVQTLTAGAQAILTDIEALPANQQPSAAVEAQIQTALTTITAQAPGIAATATASTALTAVETAIQTIAAVAEPFFPESGLIGAGLVALVTLFGAIYQQATGAAAATLAPVHTAGWARLQLQALATR